MGHTLVTRFDSESRQILNGIMQSFSANKIPFGRNCDRAAANCILDYHLTMFHWGKSQDEYYLECIGDFKPVPFHILVTETRIMRAKEDSWLLYFAVSPTQGYEEMAAALEQRIHTNISGFLHITLAVSKDLNEVEMINSSIQNTVEFPFLLRVEGLDLYHIWNPTRKVRSL